ncbi:MAG: hypothetical protein IJ781_13420, partial [Atopobiaceae bacterium]|nr:hypothetical protein [Atopobiaceae bacterium]
TKKWYKSHTPALRRHTWSVGQAFVRPHAPKTALLTKIRKVTFGQQGSICESVTQEKAKRINAKDAFGSIGG